LKLDAASAAEAPDNTSTAPASADTMKRSVLALLRPTHDIASPFF